MTEAEKRKQANRAKQAFITAATRIVLETTIVLLDGDRHKYTINLNAANTNRYFNISRFGQSIVVKIFRSGDIDVCLKEFCHDNVQFRVISYENAVLDANDALEHFRADITLLLEDFVTGDWHSLMDYMCIPDTAKARAENWRKAEAEFRAASAESEEE